jgi:WD40 repeat protein
VIDVATGEDVLGVHPSAWITTAVAWSPDGRWIASASVDLLARVTDAATGELHATLAGHTGLLAGVDWGPDATRLATASQDGTARVWEITDTGGRELLAVSARETQHGAWGVAFSPDGGRLLTGDTAVGVAKIWDVGVTGGAEWANLPAPANLLGRAAFTPDGESIVATGDGMPAVVWDLRTGESRLILDEEEPVAHPADFVVVAITVDPEGDLIATATSDGPVRVWDARSGDEVFTVGEGLTPNGVAWSPDGELLAVTGADAERGWITIVDRIGREVAEIVEDGNFVPLDVDFSPDGARLVATRHSIDRLSPTIDGARVWDWAHGEVITDIREWATVVAFDSTGTRIATDVSDGGAAIWDAATGERMVTLSGHTGVVSDVAFAPGGDVLATASADGTVRLWTTESGDERLVLRGHDGPVDGLAFSPDGSQLASVSLGEVRVWALDLDDLVDIAESRLTRALTDEECRQYLHVDRCVEG